MIKKVVQEEKDTCIRIAETPVELCFRLLSVILLFQVIRAITELMKLR